MMYPSPHAKDKTVSKFMASGLPFTGREDL